MTLDGTNSHEPLRLLTVLFAWIYVFVDGRKFAFIHLKMTHKNAYLSCDRKCIFFKKCVRHMKLMPLWSDVDVRCGMPLGWDGTYRSSNTKSQMASPSSSCMYCKNWQMTTMHFKRLILLSFLVFWPKQIDETSHCDTTNVNQLIPTETITLTPFMAQIAKHKRINDKDKL